MNFFIWKMNKSHYLPLKNMNSKIYEPETIDQKSKSAFFQGLQ